MTRAPAVALLLFAAALLFCRGRGGEPPIIDARQLPAVAGCEKDCDPVLLAELRRAVQARPPLALFDPLKVRRPERKIEEIRASGWTVGDRSFDVTPPIDWGADPFRSRNWRFRLSAMSFLVPFLQHYAATGDPASLAYARAVFLDWDEFNLRRDRENEFRWYDHATGLRAGHLAFVIDRSLRRDDLSPADLRRLLVVADQHLRHLLDPDELAPNNHALFQLAGLAGLCRAVPELSRCGGALAYASREFARIVSDQFGPDAIHTENSPFYHGYALQTIDRVMAAAWLEATPEARARLDQATGHLPWLVRPDGLYAQIGDSHGRPSQRALLRRMPRPGAGGPMHRVFPAAGYAVVRAPSPDGPERDGYLFLTAGFQSRAHKHWDALSFEWFDRGAPVLVDSGVYSTNHDPKRDYVLSTRAHNTVEIDRRNSDGGEPRPPEVIAAAERDGTFVLLAEVHHPTLMTRHRRILQYRPGEWLLVHDELRAMQGRTFTAWFHLEPGYRTERRASGELLAARTDGSAPLHLFDLAARPGDAAAIEIVRGQSEPRVQGWFTAEYGRMVANDAIGFTRRGREARFTTLLLLDRRPAAAPRLEPSPGEDGAAETTVLCWRDGPVLRGARVALRGGDLVLSPCVQPAAPAASGAAAGAGTGPGAIE